MQVNWRWIYQPGFYAAGFRWRGDYPRNSAFHSVTVIQCSGERIAGIQVETKDRKEFIVLCVYADRCTA
jgi:hypothetical protein